MEYEKVYIPDEDTYGEIISMGAHASLIKYSVGGIEYQVMLLNEDFIVEENEENY